MANIYDPNTNTQNTLIETILYWLGVMIFFSMNGHHQLIAGIQNSFNLVKVGQLILSGNFDYVINVFVQCFIIGIKIAVPMILSLLIAELLIGFISKECSSIKCYGSKYAVKIINGNYIYNDSITIFN